MNTAASGLLLFNKPAGLTSFQSLDTVKKNFSTKKAGHTGTLDKFATGLLLVLIGRGVKLAPLFANCTKEYTGSIFFGAETDTLDPEGEVIASSGVPDREKLEGVLDSFRGNIMQAPPAYSAIHINGRRAHELVREGKEPEMKTRPVTIHSLELVSWTPPLAEIRALVSPGTYIRSLARDIALACGSRAHLTALNRTAVGSFSLSEAGDMLIPIDRELFRRLSLPVFYTVDKMSFFQGRPLERLLTGEDISFEEPHAAGVFSEKQPHEFLGYVLKKNGKWVYGHVFTDS